MVAIREGGNPRAIRVMGSTTKGRSATTGLQVRITGTTRVLVEDQGMVSNQVVTGNKDQRARIVGAPQRVAMVVGEAVEVVGTKATRAVGTKAIKAEAGIRVAREAGTKAIKVVGDSRPSKAATVGVAAEAEVEDGNNQVGVAITGAPTDLKEVVGARVKRATATANSSSPVAGQAG